MPIGNARQRAGLLHRPVFAEAQLHRADGGRAAGWLQRALSLLRVHDVLWTDDERRAGTGQRDLDDPEQTQARHHQLRAQAAGDRLARRQHVQAIERRLANALLVRGIERGQADQVQIRVDEPVGGLAVARGDTLDQLHDGFAVGRSLVAPHGRGDRADRIAIRRQRERAGNI